MLVTAAAASAFQQKEPPVVTGHVGDDLAAFGLTDHRALGHFDGDILAVSAGAVLLAAFLTVFCTVFADMAEICQRV